eukprot:846759_1
MWSRLLEAQADERHFLLLQAQRRERSVFMPNQTPMTPPANHMPLHQAIAPYPRPCHYYPPNPHTPQYGTPHQMALPSNSIGRCRKGCVIEAIVCVLVCDMLYLALLCLAVNISFRVKEKK